MIWLVLVGGVLLGVALAVTVLAVWIVRSNRKVARLTTATPGRAVTGLRL